MRTWVYQTLKLSGLWVPMGGRIYQTSRMTKVPDNAFHGFYRLGESGGMLHTDAPARSTPFMLFVHDEPGDYLRIDEMLELAKVAFTALPLLYPSTKLIRCEWQGVSDDIPEDPRTGTISKFTRLRLVHLP